MKDHALDWFVGLMITAALYMLVRPSSSAPNIISNLFNDLTSLTAMSVDAPSGLWDRVNGGTLGLNRAGNIIGNLG
jgi:hypothetical protein